MTQYLLSVHGADEIYQQVDEDGTLVGGYDTKAAMEASMAAVDEFNKELQAEGHWVFAGGLEAPSTATVVDGQGATPVLTDGPYLESKEHVGGFWVIEAPDLDVALALAARASKACQGPVEVRPFQAV